MRLHRHIRVNADGSGPNPTIGKSPSTALNLPLKSYILNLDYNWEITMATTPDPNLSAYGPAHATIPGASLSPTNSARSTPIREPVNTWPWA